MEIKEINSIINNIPIPSGLNVYLSGQNKEMSIAFKSLQFALLLAIFLVYLVMASQFESFLHPLVILFTIPLALIGAVFALLITGSTISVVVFIGLILLAGIVVNNAIVLIDLINQLRAKGMTKIERQEFLREIYYERMHKKIKSILPGITIEENGQYQFDPINYLEAKLNELGKAGWELDRIRLTTPTSFIDGILIFRRKRVQ